ncbi:hypothetical protein CPLU01_13543 [Colletotrichum plurivorum]|uniref:F-box domain-containing protein n=1 Tax=Colletotrichum plurivorum TaxID=2175906 RepID=A0A8H6N2X0_9PEZI|nr:hypothetical protein CPLU01_13543 [Colletotrichum plurivorum]
MAEQPRPASFEDLPSEVVLDVLAYVADVPTLDHLLLASPNASRVFDAYGPEIVDRIFAKSVIPEIRFIMRAVALMRRSTIDKPPQADITLFFEHHMDTSRAFHKSLYSWRREDNAAFKGLLRNRSNEVPPNAFSAKELLLLARRTAIRAQKCLRRAHERFLASAPFRPAEREFCYGMYPWDEPLDGVSFAPKDAGPPSWIEMQRMVRGFWRLQLLDEITLAVATRRVGWGDTDEDVLPGALEEFYFNVLDYGHRRRPEDLRYYLYSHMGWGSQAEEVRMAQDFLKETTTNSTEPSGLAQAIDRPKRTQADVSPGAEGIGVYRKVTLWPDGTGWPPKSTSRWSPLRHLKFDTPGWKVCQRLTVARGSPLKNVPMREFRRMGFLVWEEKRLKAMGLLRIANWKPTNHFFPLEARYASSFVFTWRSYLDDDVLRTADSQAKEEWLAFTKDLRSRSGVYSDEPYVVHSDWMRV